MLPLLIAQTHQQAEKSKYLLKVFETLILIILIFSEDIRDVLQVHAGKINPRLLGVQQRNIVKYIIHPKFDYYDTGYYFDIALLILNKVIQQLLP